METVEQKILVADEGKYWFNGETYGKTVILPADADTSIWREVTEEELPKADAPIGGDDPTMANEADYQAALRDMGVKV